MQVLTSKPKPVLLVFDLSVMLYRAFYANQSVEDELASGLAHQNAFVTLNYYYKKYPNSTIVTVFDRPNWRTEYTKSEMCLSKAVYKGTRRTNQTEKQKQRHILFKQHVAEFESMVEQHTSITTMYKDMLEADDIIYGIARNLNQTYDIIVITSDKDLLQCFRYPNVSIVNPTDGKLRTLTDVDGDVEYFMYKKCIRGDKGDNVPSAFPRVRESRIKQAYNDPYEHEKLMNEQWSNHLDQTFKVGDLFEENKLLMDLECAPDVVIDSVSETIKTALDHRTQFDFFHFMKFCRQNNLFKIIEGMDKYVKLLS